MRTKDASILRLIILAARFDAAQNTPYMDKIKEPTGLNSSWSDLLEVQVCRRQAPASSRKGGFCRKTYVKLYFKYKLAFSPALPTVEYGRVKRIFLDAKKRAYAIEKEERARKANSII